VNSVQLDYCQSIDVRWNHREGLPRKPQKSTLPVFQPTLPKYWTLETRNI